MAGAAAGNDLDPPEDLPGAVNDRIVADVTAPLAPTAGDATAPTGGDASAPTAWGATAPWARPAASTRLVRAGIATALAVLAAWGFVLLLRQGIQTNTFPAFISGQTGTPITRYSGPWLTAAAGAAFLAALLLLFAVLDLLGWNRARRVRPVLPPPV